MSSRFTCCRLIQTTPPTGRLARACLCRGSARFTCARCRVRVVALEVFPVEAIGTINHRPAFCRRIVLLQYIFDDYLDPMIAHTTAPPKVLQRVVDAGHARVTHGLHGVAGYGAHGRKSVASAHENGISCMTKVIATGELTLLVKAQVVTGW